MANGDDAGAGTVLQLPQQDAGGLPALAQNLAPPPTAEQTLLPAAYGDKGAQQYQDLRSAGQQQTPAPMAPPMATPPMPGPPPTSGGLPQVAGLPPAGFAGPVSALGYGLAGGNIRNAVGMAMQRQRMQLDAQRAAQNMAINDATFVEKLQNEPLDVRASMIQAYAMKQGRDVSPAEARYIAQIDPAHLEQTRMMAEQGDVTALANLKALFGGNPIDMVTAKTDITKRVAEAERAVHQAEASRFEPFQAQAKLQEAQLAITRQGGGLPSPPDNKREIQANAVRTPNAPNGMTYVPLKVPGVPGAQAWYAVPRDANNQPIIPEEFKTDVHAASPATTPPKTGTPEAPTTETTAQRSARLTQEAKAPPAMQQRVLTQIDTALAPINKLEQMLKDPQYADVVNKMGPKTYKGDASTFQNPFTGSTRAWNQDAEGTAHDSISHPLNGMWYNYKQGGADMTPQEREMMAVIGTVSASGWQGLTSGIRNRAVIEDVKQHIPRPWDDPGLVDAKIGWIRDWYGAIKKGIAESGQTYKDLQDPNAANPFNIPFNQPGGSPAPTGGPPSGPGAGAPPPAQVTTRADVEALPTGAAYINPSDGRILYKK